MKDLGLLMSAEMAIAWFEGRKTQTRRPLSPQPEPATAHPECRAEWLRLETTTGAMFRPIWHTPDGRGGTHVDWGDLVVPHIADIGKRVWCRETFCISDRYGDCEPCLTYRAGGPAIESRSADESELFADAEGQCWTPSIHMPKWAARSWGEIVAVRVERAQYITEDDAEAEGFFAEDDAHPLDPVWATDSFQGAWNAIYASKGLGWGANPWVFVIEWKHIDVPNLGGNR